MSQRAYTINEVDLLRQYVWQQGDLPRRDDFSSGVDMSAHQSSLYKIVEEKVRTMMIAGIDPLDLNVK